MFLSGGGWALIGTATLITVGFAVNAVLARLLTPENLGLYFIALSFTTGTAMFATFGLNLAVVRLTALSTNPDSHYSVAGLVGLVFRNAMIPIALVSCIAALVFYIYIGPKFLQITLSAGLALLIGTWVIMLALQSLVSAFFRGLHDIKLASLFDGILGGLFTLVALTLYWKLRPPEDVDTVIVVIVLSALFSLLIATFLLSEKLKRVQTGRLQYSVGYVLHQTWPFWISNVLFFVLSNADLWLVALFLSPEEIAAYGAAMKLALLVALPLVVANAVLPPIIAKEHAKKNFIQLQDLLKTTASIALIPALVTTIVFSLWGSEVLSWVFGPYYRSAAIALAILSFGHLISVVTGSCGQLLMMTGHQVYMFSITVIVGTLTLLFAYLLVKDYGTTGVAIAFGLGMAAQNVLVLIFSKRLTGVSSAAKPLQVNEIRRLISHLK